MEFLAQQVTCVTPLILLNMKLFADSSAELCLEAMLVTQSYARINARTVHKETSDEGNVDHLFDRSSHIQGDATVMKDFYQHKDALHVLVRGNDEVLFSTSTELALPTLHALILSTRKPFPKYTTTRCWGRVFRGGWACRLSQYLQ